MFSPGLSLVLPSLFVLAFRSGTHDWFYCAHRASTALQMVLPSLLVCSLRKGGPVESRTARVERPRHSPPLQIRWADVGVPRALDQLGRPCPILLSVPFHNRAMLSLCLNQISALTTIENTRNSCRCSFTIATTGNSPNAASAPPDE